MLYEFLISLICARCTVLAVHSLFLSSFGDAASTTQILHRVNATAKLLGQNRQGRFEPRASRLKVVPANLIGT
jgi:hypothetical protein